MTALLPVLLVILVGASPAHAWTWPADGPVLQTFRFGGDPYAAGHHRGIDIGGETGAPVRAPASGRVTFAGTVPRGGRTVTVTTADGYAVTLVHLGAFSVRRGASVGEGEVVGSVGPSGDPEHAVPYVHLGVRVASEPEGYVDPLSLLPERRPAPAPSPSPAPESPAAPAAPPSGAAAGGEAAPKEATPVQTPAASAPAAGGSSTAGAAAPQQAPVQAPAADTSTAAGGSSTAGAAAPEEAKPVQTPVADKPAAAGGSSTAGDVAPDETKPAEVPPEEAKPVQAPAADKAAPAGEAQVEESAPAGPGSAPAASAGSSAAAAGAHGETVAGGASVLEPAEAGSANPGQQTREPRQLPEQATESGAAPGARARAHARASDVRDARRLPAGVLAKAPGSAARRADRALGVDGSIPAPGELADSGHAIQARDGGWGANRLVLVAAAGVLAVALGAALRRRLNGLPAAQAEPVTKRGDNVAAQALQRAERGDEARAPLVSFDFEAAPAERIPELTRATEADVSLVPGKEEVAGLQALDHMSRVRRVDRERPPRDEHADALTEHAIEGHVPDVLDEIGRHRLVERPVGKGKLRHVGDFEAKRRKERPRRGDRARLRVHADGVARVRRKEVRHGPCRAPEVEHSLSGCRLDEVTHRRKAEPRPRRLVEVRRRHRVHEPIVVLGRRPAEEPESHVPCTR